jgi:membrane protease YdiL (CAAX protease family)
MSAPRRRTVIEIIIVCGISAAGLLVYSKLGHNLPGETRHWLVPAVFLYAPVIAVFLTDRNFKAVGLSLPTIKKAGTDLAVFFLAILPVFLVGWWVIYTSVFGQNFNLVVPSGLGALIIWQVLGTALPEEVFFRGWLQGRLNRMFGRKWKLFGTKIGIGLFLAALIFALGHMIDRPVPVQLLVFFPGLLFGLFRERSGSVLVPVLAHAGGNVTFIILQASLN